MTFGMISIAETTTDIITVDTPIEKLNDLTLNELFIDNNLVLNHDFSDGSTNWVNPFFTNQIVIYNNETVQITSVTTGARGIYQPALIINDTFYLKVEVKPTSNFNLFLGDSSINYNLTPNVWNDASRIYTPSASTFYRLYMNSTSIGDIVEFDNIYAINLTSLALTSLTKTQLDYYYDIYSNGGYYEYDAILNDLDMTDFIIISSSFVLWLWFMRFVKGVL
jgi:hypothetical protein